MRRKKVIVIITLVFVLSFCTMVSAYASTGYGTGTKTMNWFNAYTCDVWGTVYCNVNNSTTLDVDSIVEWVKNYSSSYGPVDNLKFAVNDAQFVKDHINYGIIDCQPGETLRYETDWWKVAYQYAPNDPNPTKYQKNNSVYVHMKVGYGGQDGSLGGFMFNFTPTNHTVYFEY